MTPLTHQQPARQTNNASRVFHALAAGALMLLAATANAATPVFDTAAPTSVNEESLYTYSVSASDADGGDTVTLAVLGPALPAWLTFTPTAGNPGTGTLSGTPNDAQLAGSPFSITLRASQSGGGGPSDQSFSITVNPVNDAPVLNAAATHALSSQPEDDQDNAGTLVSGLLTPGGTGSVTDEDSGALLGMAITATNTTNGDWEYSIDAGANWVSFPGGIANTNALLLRGVDKLRLLPDADFNGDIATAITFRAWDVTSGTQGTTADASTNGDATAFSSATDTALLSISQVNDAPVLDNTAILRLTAINEDDTSNAGTTIATLLASDSGNTNPVIDVDASAAEGIAITASNTTNGDWQYSITNGSSWVNFPTIAANDALLLRANDLVRFQPDAHFNGGVTSAITFHAWDRNVGTQGTKANPSTNGGTTPFSTATDTADLTVNPANDAPVLDNTATLVLTAQDEDDADSAGTSVSDLLTSDLVVTDPITDIDASALEGIAITGVDTTDGDWEYSTNNGADWLSLASADDENALVLSPANLIRFQPDTDFNGAVTGGITFRAWDRTSGSAGNTVDADPNGGTTAFSSESDTASLTINAVNDAPEVTSSAVTSVNEDAAYSYAITVDDEDGDNLTISSGTLPTWLTLDVTDNGTAAPTATLTGTPDDADVAGSPFAITIEVTDGVVVTPSSQSFNITVTPVNDPPAFVAVPATTVNEESPYSFVATVSDPDTLPADDNLTITLESTLPSWLSFVANNNGTPNPTANLTGTPNDADLPGSPVSVTLRVTDGTVPVDLPFSITINPVNDAPVLDNTGDMELTSINEDNTSSAGDTVGNLLATGILDPVTDEDAGALEGIAITIADATNGSWQYSITAGSSWVNFPVVAADSALLLGTADLIRFQPATDFNGTVTDPITFQAWDRSDSATPGSLGDPSANGLATPFSLASDTFSIIVLPVNDPPVANDDPTGYTLPADGPREEVEEDTLTFIDVLANDTDVEGLDPTTVTITGFPTRGAAGVNPTTGELQYLPNKNFTGKDQLTYRVTDIGDNGAPTLNDSASLFIEVVAANDPPVVGADSASTDSGIPVTIDVLANDSDEETDLTPVGVDPKVTVVTPPTGGNVTIDGPTGHITYTSNGAFQGVDTFTYSVEDFGLPLPAKSSNGVVTILVSQAQITVSTLDDNDDGDLAAGEVSFREAVKLVASNGTIDFDPALFGVGQATITLDDIEIVALKGFTLTGPGADKLDINADGLTRVVDFSTGTFDITGVTFSNGLATNADGGALRVQSTADLTLDSCIILDSTATGSGNGGGIAAEGPLTLENTTIAGNSAGGAGGAIYVLGGMQLVNSTLSGNTAGTNGGAIEVAAGDVNIVHATIVFNDALTGGAVSRVTGAVQVTNSILTGNTAGGAGADVSGIFTPDTTNLIGSIQGSEGFEDTVLLGNTAEETVEPDLGSNGGATLTHALLPDGAAIDAANPASAPTVTTDQRGASFPRDAAPDLGAYEIRFFTVDTAVDETDGDFSAGDLSLREAVENSLPGDTVLFDPSIGDLTIDPGNGYIQVEHTVGIFGPDGGTQVIDGNDLTQLLYVPGTTTQLVLRNLTLTRAFDDGLLQNRGGPGLRSFGICRLYDCLLTLNNAPSLDGGAVRNNGTMTFTRCDISNNNAGNLGGAIINWAGTLTLDACTLQANFAGQTGGAIQNQLGGSVTIRNSALTGNSADTSGAIHNATNGTLSLYGSTITLSNATSDGGAISNLGDMTAVNSTFSFNRAFRSGGAVHHSGASAVLTNCTVTQNFADELNNGFGEGGGIYVQVGKVVTLGNTIVAVNFDTPDNAGQGNIHPDISGSAVSLGNNFMGDRTGSIGLTDGTIGDIVGSGTIRKDPRLGPLADNGGLTLTHLPKALSSVLDAGSNALVTEPLFGATPADQRGGEAPDIFARILDANGDGDALVDIGAVEFVPTSPVITSVPGLTIDEDDFYNYTLTTTDADQEEVFVITAPTLPFWLTFAQVSNSGAVIFGTPTNETIDPNFASDTFDVVLRVTDSEQEFIEQAFTITVNGVNDAPEPVTDTAVLDEDTESIIPVLENDLDDDGGLPIGNVAVFSQPAHGTATADLNTGAITYTPNLNYNGPDSFVYSITDDGTPLPGLTTNATVNITVNAINDAPALTADAAITDEDTNVIINVAGNDSDVDGALDLDTLVIITPPAHGVATVNTATGEISYAPEENYNGTDFFEYQITDDGAPTPVASSIAQVNVTINAVNDVITPVDDTASVNEDGTIIIDVLGNDTDVDGVPVAASVFVNTPPTSGSVTVNPATGEITYTPDPDFNGTETFTYEVTDDGAPLPGLTAQATVTVTVNAVNDAPDLTGESVTTLEDTAVVVDVLANDSDVDGTLVPASVNVTVAPTNGIASVNAATGEITYTPNADFNGTDSLTYQVADDGTPTPVLTTTATINFTITAVNDAPRLGVDNVTTNEDIVLVVPVLTNDSDVDGNLVLNTLSVVDSPLHGAVTVDRTASTITYTPSLNYNGPDTFTYRINDDGAPTPALQSVGTVNVQVTAVNDAPALSNDAGFGNEDGTILVSVLANDSDVDGLINPSTLTVVSGPTNGSVQLNLAQGLVTYTPVADFNGVDSLTYSITDTGTPTPVLTSTATVQFNVQPVNDAPRLLPDTATVNEDETVTFSPLANDADVDGNLLPGTLRVTGQAEERARVTVNPVNGDVTIAPGADVNGLLEFAYEITDDGSPAPGLSTTGLITLTVNAVNDAPRTVADSATTNEDTSVIIPVLANDTDVDGDLLVQLLAIAVQPQHGAVSTDLVNGRITYTPALNYNGPDSFSYSITDDGEPLPGLTTVQSVAVTVNAVNDQPVVLDDFYSTLEDTPVVTTPLDNDTDVEGPLNPATITITRQPAKGRVSVNGGTGAITYTPNANSNGVDTFDYRVSDTGTPLPVLTDTATVSISVQAENDTLTANDDIATTAEEQAIVVNVLSNDTDIDGSLTPSTVQVTTPPLFGTTRVNPASGAITYTPNNNYFGDDSFTYIVGDNGTPTPGKFDSANVSITVTPVNDAPMLTAPASKNGYQQNLLAIPGITVGDVDAEVVPNGSVSVTLNAGHGTLSVSSSVATVTGSGTASVTVTGRQTPVNAVLATLSYLGDPLFYGPDAISVTATDLGNFGAGGVKTATKSVRINLTPTTMVVTDLTDERDGNISVGNVSLREAIEAIADGGTITFDETLEGLISLSLVRGPLTIDKNLSIFGPGSETISISGGTDIRVIQVFQLDESRQPQVLIKGLSIVQGEAGVGAPAFFQQDGGGILNVGADLTLDEVRLSGNSALNGGAIYNTGSVTLVNCTGSGNIAEFQGGFLATTGQGEVFIQNTTIADNAARLGGGISAAGKTTLINSTLSGNRAFDSGGGLHHTAAAKTTLVNCTVFSNVADTTGAANGNGGGIFVVSGAAPVDLRNTIVGGNFDNTGTGGVKHPDLSGQFFGAQSNLVGDPTGSVGIGGTDVVLSLVGDSMNEVIEPVLADNGGPTLTHDLRLFSPAVNAGTNLFIADALYGADQRGPGFDRIRRGIVDIGAIELQPNSDGLTVVIELDPAQDTLTAYMPLRFFITFSEAVQDFTADDLDNAGTAPNVVFTVTPIGGGVYEILANTDSNGTIIPRLRPGSVTDSWSTATDLTDPSAIIVGFDTTLDTDSDGVLDIDEAQTDADGDGDADFLDADADNDGVPDGIEADLGTDPTDTTTPDSTLTLSQSDFEVGENGGTVTITLVKYGAAVLNWQAIVESGGEWLTITTGESGTDGGVIVLTYDRNLTQVNRAAAVELTAPGASAFPRTIVVRQAACALPDAPANAIAQLVEDDSILRIQWDVAAGATEYELRLSANPLLPPIAIVDENSFDIAYNPPTGLFANCNGDFIDPTQQTYFVRSVNDCGPSAFSQALSNIDTKAQPDALPAIAPDAEVRAVSSNEPVALRLEAAAPINADTLWYEAPVEATAEFIPLDEDGHTGWALIAPVGEWPADATFTVSAGGVNAQGIAVSLSADFAVGKAKAAGATVISGGLFAEPQTVSLPVPAGLDAATAEVEFYIGDGAAPGWYPVAQVEGLLPTPEYFVDGNSIAVSINYGGAFRVVDGTLGTTPASGIPTGDALLAALILIALAAGARVCRKSVVAVPAGS